MAAGGPLFSSGGSRSGAFKKSLVEFRAGKMTLEGSLVSPDKRKGMILIEKGDDQLMHFKWKDRSSDKTEDDLIIFPDDVEFRRVSQCTTGRVYLLKFKSTNRKMFFWMQEPKEDRDEELCKSVNEYLNKPPIDSSSSGRSGLDSSTGLDLSSLADSDLQSLLNNMSQHQLAQLFGGGLGQHSSRLPLSIGGRHGPSSTSVIAGSRSSSKSEAKKSFTPKGSEEETVGQKDVSGVTATGKAPIKLTDLQSFLSGINVPKSNSVSVDLASSLSSGKPVEDLLKKDDFVEKMSEFLPSPLSSNLSVRRHEIEETLKSPQFHQAVSAFSAGFQSGQLAPLMREFNLNQDAVSAATKGDLKSFVVALEENGNGAEKKTESGGGDDLPLD